MYEVCVPENKIVDRIDNWIKGVFETSNIHRKVENDWRMTYLARTGSILVFNILSIYVLPFVNLNLEFLEESNGSDVGKLSWRVQVNDDKKKIFKITIKLSSQIYENGNVKWTLFYKDNITEIPKSLGKFNFKPKIIAINRTLTFL